MWKLVTVLALLIIASAEAMPAERALPDGVIVFKQGSNDLAPEDIAVIDRISARAKSDPANWVILKACTNDFGSSEMNLALGQQRTSEIEHEMVSRGVQPYRIRSVSFDDACIDNDGRPMHRVDVLVKKPGV